ncbi:MAG TPA: HD domain-containing protein [Candidatus Acidoferrum sp.]|jgi:3'-5' exoribonuclease|nr:HD domain-containing protein [Candidatus Acidoferrum sp.]
MKSGFVRDLADGQAVVSLFLVREKEIRTSPRTGKSWLQLSLGDRTGTISAKMWDNYDALVSTFERDDVIQIRGRVKTYNGEKELTIEQIVPAAERDYEMGDFLPHTKFDVEKLYAALHAAVASVKNPWLQKLLVSVVDDPEIAPRLKRAPAAMTMHHAFLGGLLEHIVSLLALANALAMHYPELDGDLLVTGVVLHDIGKTEELRYTRGIDYTTEGRLLGHITIGAMLVRKKIDSIAGFPQPLAVLVEHLILSHHGSLEFASPTLPQTREALALHFIDDVDSKMAAARATIEAAEGAPGVWTDRNPALRRPLVRPDQYLAGARENKNEQKPDSKPAVKVEVAVKKS